jgi:hypothetical protein
MSGQAALGEDQRALRRGRESELDDNVIDTSLKLSPQTAAIEETLVVGFADMA